MPLTANYTSARLGAYSAVEGIGDMLRYGSPRMAWKVFAGANLTTAASPVDVFTVTAICAVRCFAVTVLGLTSTSNDGTIELGIAGNTAALLPQTIIDGSSKLNLSNDIWVDANASDQIDTIPGNGSFMVSVGKTIILTIGTNNITGGSLMVICRFFPLEDLTITEPAGRPPAAVYAA